MNRLSNTTRYAFVSLLFFTISMVVAGFGFSWVSDVGSELDEKLAIIGKANLRQDEYNQLSKILNDTKLEHDQLRELLLTEETTINFLSEIEALARQTNLKFTTDSLDVKPLPNDTFSLVELKFKAEGDKQSIVRFLNTLETVPFYSYIDFLRLERNNQPGVGVWSAIISLKVGMHSYDQ